MLGSKDIFLDRAKRELSVMQMNHCGIQECEKGHMWQFQARPYHLLHFVLQGEGALKISGRMLNVHAGQAFFIPAGMEGKYIASLQNPYKGAKVPLYDYQEEAVGAMIDNHYGILQSPAGSGKTQIGIALACALGLKTLWLTHTKDLLTQSKNRAAQYIDKSLLGTITEGKVNIGETMTFATIQTMCKVDLDQYRDTWDCIIVDECHRVAGTPTAVTQFSNQKRKVHHA